MGSEMCIRDSGGSYGLSPYVRFSFATATEVIEQGMDRLAAAVNALMAG